MRHRACRVTRFVLFLQPLILAVTIANAQPCIPNTQPCIQKPFLTRCWWPADDHAASLTPRALPTETLCPSGSLLGNAYYGSGRVGKAFGFDSTTGYISLGNTLNDITFPFTLEAWINTSDVGDNVIFASDDETRTYGTWFGVDTARQIYLCYGRYALGNDYRCRRSSKSVLLNSWTHVAAVAVSSTDITLYINGLDAGGANLTPPTPPMVHTSSPATIGKRTSSYFGGKIDELVLYSRALSPCEILEAYQAGQGTCIGGANAGNPCTSDASCPPGPPSSFCLNGKCKGDSDSDGINDPVDNCPFCPNPSQLNTDFDFAGDACDCAYDDSAVFSNPWEVQGDRILSNRSTFTWCSVTAGTGTSYDIVRGDLSWLPVNLGSHQVCLQSFLTGTSLNDTYVPLPGKGSWYLSRARNYCGVGTYGRQSNGVERTTNICP